MTDERSGLCSHLAATIGRALEAHSTELASCCYEAQAEAVVAELVPLLNVVRAAWNEQNDCCGCYRCLLGRGNCEVVALALAGLPGWLLPTQPAGGSQNGDNQ